MPEKVNKTPEQALASLMRLCSRAEKSSGDALRLMSRWGVDPSKRQEVLRRLIKERFIDDERYAEAFVREKSRLDGWGEYKIKQGLRAKGIAADVIARHVGALSKDESADRLMQMMTRRYRATKESDVYKLKGKLLRYGLSLGYEYDCVSDIVERIVNSKDDDF